MEAMIEWHGQKMTIAEAAREAGLPRVTVSSRLIRGWSTADALGAKRKYGAFRHLLTPDQRLAYDRIRKDTKGPQARNEALRAIGRADLVKS
jgi:hypothetical protein